MRLSAHDLLVQRPPNIRRERGRRVRLPLPPPPPPVTAVGRHLPVDRGVASPVTGVPRDGGPCLPPINYTIFFTATFWGAKCRSCPMSLKTTRRGMGGASRGPTWNLIESNLMQTYYYVQQYNFTKNASFRNGWKKYICINIRSVLLLANVCRAERFTIRGARGKKGTRSVNFS